MLSSANIFACDGLFLVIATVLLGSDVTLVGGDPTEGAAPQRTIDGTPEEDGPQCHPELPIFHMVMKFNEVDFIRTGPPQPSAGPITNLKGCEKWTDGSCCTDDFFDQVKEIWNAEAKRFIAVRDYYQRLVEDRIQPAIAMLDERNEAEVAQKVTDLRRRLEESEAAEEISKYIEACEDQIRIFFSTTLCELCDPELTDKVRQQRTLAVRREGCQALHAQCKDMPDRLKAASETFRETGIQMEELTSGVSRGLDAVLDAVTSLKSASIVTAKVAERIDFYRNEEQMCDHLQEEGFAYRPGVWANLDQLHPGSLQLQEGEANFDEQAMAGVGTQATAWGEKDFGTGWMNGAKPPRFQTRYGVKPPQSCERGGTLKKMPGGSFECECLPCFTGNRCEVKIEARALSKQRFRPLISSKDAQPQSIIVAGCNMPTDLQSQMAHIKFVPGHRLTPKEKSALLKVGLTADDVCLVRPSAPGFESLLTQIPVAAMSEYSEWQIHVQQIRQDKSSVKHFAVCFCYGPECFEEVQMLDEKPGENDPLVIHRKYKEKDALSWYTAGHIAVHYTDLASSSETSYTGLNSNWYSIRNMQPERSCGEQWAYGNYLQTHGVVAEKRERNMVRFSCDKNFIDMQGPHWLKCVDGIWFEEPDELDKEYTETLTRWNLELPYCRWKFSSCDKRKLGNLKLDNGAINVANGVARYACNADFQLVVGADAKPVPAASYLKWCTEDGTWEPIDEVMCESRILRSAARMPGTEPAETILAANQRYRRMPTSFIELSHEEAHNFTEEGMRAEDTLPPPPPPPPLADENTPGPPNSTSFLELGEDVSKEARGDQRDVNDTIPSASSFVELGASAQQRQSSAQKARHRSATETSKDGVETSRRLKMKVHEFAEAAAREERWSMAPPRGVLQIHPWPIEFSNDPSHLFEVDTCLFTHGCSPDGRIRLDTIDSPLFVYRPPARQRSVPWSVITAATASVVVSLAVMVMITKGKKSDPQA